MAYTTIDDPTIHFTTLLRNSIYGGSDTSYDIGFQPDWIWDKVRSTTGVNALFDSVRGVGSSGKVLYSNDSVNEATNALIKSIDSSGFTVTANSDHSSQTIVDWCWKAGGSASSNTDGSITSSVSANTTAGFSIVSYTGTGSTGTVAHGLGSVPQVVICKKRSGASYDESWYVYHVGKGNTHALSLNSTGAGEDNTFWNDTTPTSSVFTVGTDNVNRSGNLFIAYCFAEKKGYSKFGSYTGNGSSDGTYVHLGFKPSFVMVKDSSNAGYNWMMYDNKRLGYNGGSRYLIANENYAEGGSSDNLMDFTSNGFKLRIADQNINRTHTYIYMAFSESPFVTSTGIPTTAR